MKRRGFTIVEISVVVVIIAILTVLGIASLRSSQVAARDDERLVKAETIARALEGFYQNGDPSRSINPGRYPTGAEMTNAISGGYITEWLDETDTSMLRFSWQAEGENNLSVLSTSTYPMRDQTENTSRINSAVSGGKIVYEPLAIWDGSRTPGDNDAWVSCHMFSGSNITTCNRYNLYFQKEADSSVVTIRSERQR